MATEIVSCDVLIVVDMLRHFLQIEQEMLLEQLTKLTYFDNSIKWVRD